MSELPLVSVCMITYNHRPYIVQAIEGVLQQTTRFSFELVIGEDCSTDGTREIVFDYQKRFPDRVRVVTSERNVGARENGVRTQFACRGKYLAYCEGDDYWHHPEKLQRQVEFLESHPDYGLVHCDALNCNTVTGKTELPPRRPPEYEKDEDCYFDILARRRRIKTLTVVVRKDLIDKVVRDNPECSDKRFRMGDLQRWLELSRVTKIKFLPEVMATHNLLLVSAASHFNVAGQLRNALSIREWLQHYTEKYPCPPETKQTLLFEQTQAIVRYAYYAGDSKTVRTEIETLRQFCQKLPFKYRCCHLVSRHGLLHRLSLPAARFVGEAVGRMKRRSLHVPPSTSLDDV